MYQHLSNNRHNVNNNNDTSGELIPLDSISSHHDDSDSNPSSTTGKPGAESDRDTTMTVVENAGEGDVENDTSSTDETASLLGAPVEKVRLRS